MELNINNYEEYFLLYADNELSVEEMKHVEVFVSENPVLKEEFEQLLRTISAADTTIELGDKSFLYKRASSFESRPHDENFVLYHDGELSKVEETEVERLIQDPAFRKEFEELKRARLEADEVIFPDKHLLYKKEKDRVIPLVRRWAAAAMLLGFGIWAGVKYLEPAPTEDVAKGKTVVKQKTNDLPTPLNREHTAAVEKKEEKPSNQEVRQDISPVVRVKHVTNDLPVATYTDNKNKNSNQQNYADAKDQEKDINTALQNVQKTLDNVMRGLDNLNRDSQNQRTTQPNNEYTLQNASYIEDNNNAGNEDYAFYNVTKKDFNKSKLGVLLKKTKRIIGRNLFRKKDKDSND
jgi:hypothetical protein